MEGKTKKRKLSIVLLIIIILILASAGYFFLTLDKPLDSSDNKTKIVTINRGATTSDIAKALESEKLIGSALKFKIYSKIKHYDGKFSAGTYELSPSMKPSLIAKTIVENKESTTTVTIQEGLTISQIENKLYKAHLIDRQKFKDIVENYDFNFKFLKDIPRGENRLEGFLFPATYSFPKGISEKEIVETMLKKFDEEFTGKYYKRAKEKGLSVKEAITIASIIEREAQKESERPKVSSVIYNRLKKDMKLQMCSTIQYILKTDKVVLSEKDIATDSPYNTYVNEGLPPGPISNPGKNSIKAALYPAKTNYIYFVVSDKLDGSMVYSKSYSKFLKEKKAYYKALEKK